MANEIKNPAAIENPQKNQVPALPKPLSARDKAKLLNKTEKFDYAAYGIDMSNFHLHWANENGPRGSNIEIYEKVGYTICRDKKGNAIKKTPLNGGITQVLMQIPLDMYNEIQYHRLEEAREADKAIGKEEQTVSSNKLYYDDKTKTRVEIIK